MLFDFRGRVFKIVAEFKHVSSSDSDVGDIVMLMTLWWWLIWDIGSRIVMLATFFIMLVIFSMYLIGHQHPEPITDILNLSPTHLVSNIRH